MVRILTAKEYLREKIVAGASPEREKFSEEACEYYII